MTSEVIEGHNRTHFYLEIHFYLDFFCLQSNLIDSVYEGQHYEHKKNHKVHIGLLLC